MDWKSIVGDVAPTIATALGGPYAGMAVKALASKFGCEPTEDAVKAKVQAAVADPEEMLKIKQCEDDFLVSMEKLGIQREQLVMADRASARELAEKTSIWPQVFITAFLFGSIVFLVWGISVGKIDAAGNTMIAMIVGALMKEELPKVVAYWFGGDAGVKKPPAN